MKSHSASQAHVSPIPKGERWRLDENGRAGWGRWGADEGGGVRAGEGAGFEGAAATSMAAFIALFLACTAALRSSSVRLGCGLGFL